MMESTDTRGLGRALCVALMAAAVSGCATLSAVDAPDYDDSMATAEMAMLGDDAVAAIQAYQRAAEAAPAQPLPWLEIAEIQAGIGDWPQAVAASREVLDRAPDDAAAQDIYVRGSFNIALDALPYLATSLPHEDGRVRKMAGDVLGALVITLGDEAIPAETRARLEAEVEARLRRQGLRHSPPRANPKAPEKLATDPFDVLGDG